MEPNTNCNERWCRAEQGRPETKQKTEQNKKHILNMYVILQITTNNRQIIFFYLKLKNTVFNNILFLCPLPCPSHSALYLLILQFTWLLLLYIWIITFHQSSTTTTKPITTMDSFASFINTLFRRNQIASYTSPTHSVFLLFFFLALHHSFHLKMDWSASEIILKLLNTPINDPSELQLEGWCSTKFQRTFLVKKNKIQRQNKSKRFKRTLIYHRLCVWMNERGNERLPKIDRTFRECVFVRMCKLFCLIR